jgi:hypothetical protein
MSPDIQDVGYSLKYIGVIRYVCLKSMEKRDWFFTFKTRKHGFS